MEKLKVTRCGSRVFLLAAMVLVSVALLPACANDQQRTRAEGAGIGAVLGAVLGHMAAGRDGAIAGAALGGAIGGVAGNEVAQKKQAYVEREDALKLAAAKSQETARQARQANELLKRDIAQLETSAARLQNEQLTARDRSQLATLTLRSLQEANSRVDQQLVAVRGEIDNQMGALKRDRQLAHQTREASPQAEFRRVSLGIDGLREQERSLERAKAQLALLDPRRRY